MLRCIDIHAHGFPEVYLRRIATLYPADIQLVEEEPTRAIWQGVPLPAWNRGRRLAEMDRDAVDLEVLSAPSLYSWMDENTAELCALLNDFQAAQGPRFRSFIHLPVHDIPAALAELERSTAVRPAGVLMASNMGGMYPGDSRLLPIWDAVADLGLVVFIHPNAPSPCFGTVGPPVVLFPCDTTTAAASIIYTGLFERHPGLVVILPHYGGALPFLAARLDMGLDVPGFPPGHGQDLPHRPSTYVARFFLDTAQGFHEPAWHCARAAVGLHHMLYGSDHFLLGNRWRAQLNAFLETLPLDTDDRAALLAGNATRVLGLLAPDALAQRG